MWIWMESHNGGGTRKQPGQGRYSNDSEWDGSSTSRGSFIMHNLYTKLRAEGGGAGLEMPTPGWGPSSSRDPAPWLGLWART